MSSIGRGGLRLPELLPTLSRHLKDDTEGKGLVGNLDPELLILRQEGALDGFGVLQILQLLSHRRVCTILRQAKLFAQPYLLHTAGCQFLQQLNLLLFNLLDVATKGVAGIPELRPLRGGQSNIALRVPCVDTLRAFAGLRTDNAFRTSLAGFRFRVLTFGTGCYFDTVVLNLEGQVFASERLRGRHRDTEGKTKWDHSVINKLQGRS
jgi:hypothetical protein